MDIEEALKPCPLPKVTDAKDLIVGEWYWLDWKPARAETSSFEIEPYGEVTLYALGNLFENGFACNQNTTDRLASREVYGPIPRPEAG